jgi:hypothetical protein
VQATAARLAMGVACLLVASLSALQNGADALQIDGAGFDIKRKRRDQSVGGVADLA